MALIFHRSLRGCLQFGLLYVRRLFRETTVTILALSRCNYNGVCGGDGKGKIPRQQFPRNFTQQMMLPGTSMLATCYEEIGDLSGVSLAACEEVGDKLATVMYLALWSCGELLSCNLALTYIDSFYKTEVVISPAENINSYSLSIKCLKSRYAQNTAKWTGFRGSLT